MTLKPALNLVLYEMKKNNSKIALKTLLVTIFLLAGCSQKTADITYKGHLYFTKGTIGQNKYTKNKNASVTPRAKRKVTKIDLNPAANQIKVKSGDNLHNIARRHKVPLKDLIEYNNLKQPYVIYPGEVLNISSRKTHIVRSGENLTHLAKLYNVTITELAQVNNITNKSKIKIGDILILPYDASLDKAPEKKSLAKKSAPKKQQNTSKDNFIWPVAKGKIIAKFGSDGKGGHNDGVNIKADLGAAVKAVAAGKVVYVGNELRGYGNLIIIKHSNNWLTAYAHNNEIYVAKEQKISQGETISTVGSTGNVETPQLHFGLRKGRKAVNPEKYIKGKLSY